MAKQKKKLTLLLHKPSSTDSSQKWCADLTCFSGAPPIGYGASKAEAVADWAQRMIYDKHYAADIRKALSNGARIELEIKC